MGWDAFTVYRSNLPSQPFNIPTVGTFAFFYISIVLKIMVRVDGTSERFTISDILWSLYCSSVLAAAACLN